MSPPEAEFKEPYKTNGIKICEVVAKISAPRAKRHAKKTVLRKVLLKFKHLLTSLKHTITVIFGLFCDVRLVGHVASHLVCLCCPSLFFLWPPFMIYNDHVVCINFNASYLHEGVV